MPRNEGRVAQPFAPEKDTEECGEQSRAGETRHGFVSGRWRARDGSWGCEGALRTARRNHLVLSLSALREGWTGPAGPFVQRGPSARLAHGHDQPLIEAKPEPVFSEQSRGADCGSRRNTGVFASSPSDCR